MKYKPLLTSCLKKKKKAFTPAPASLSVISLYELSTQQEMSGIKVQA
jgi:hypothetical protein